MAAIRPHPATGVVAILGGRDHVAGMNEQVLRNMMARVERCRLIARDTTDERAARALSRIAEEGQADIEVLFAEIMGKGEKR